MTEDQAKRELELIETEINLWRTPWQNPDTSEGEKDLIFKRVLQLIDKEKEILDEFPDLNFWRWTNVRQTFI